MHTTNIRGIAIMLLAIGAFSAMDALLKFLAADYSPLQVSALRGAASLPFLLLPTLVRGNWQSLRPQRIPVHLLRGALMVIVMTSFVYAVSQLTLADTYAVFLAAPLIVTALSVPLLGEQVGPRRWLAIAVGICGALTMLRPSGANLVSLGALAALLSAVCYAVSAITVRWLTRSESTGSIVIWSLATMTVVCAALAAPSWAPVQPSHWWVIIAIGAVGAVAQYLFTEAFRAAPASVIAPFEYSALLWGMGIDWFVWQVAPSSRVLLGGSIVITSGLYIIWRERARPLASG
ncbi:MAG: DMT family transporter [Steroidobacteraceae bacterium]